MRMLYGETSALINVSGRIMLHSMCLLSLPILFSIVPTPFKDINNLSLNFDALKDYVDFLLGNGLDRENCTLLFGGAAGDFSAKSFDERSSLAS